MCLLKSFSDVIHAAGEVDLCPHAGQGCRNGIDNGVGCLDPFVRRRVGCFFDGRYVLFVVFRLDIERPMEKRDMWSPIGMALQFR